MDSLFSSAAPTSLTRAAGARALLSGCFALCLWACNENPPKADPSAKSSDSTTAGNTAPSGTTEPTKAEGTLKQGAGQHEGAGQQGSVRGIITVKGDVAPTIESVAPKIPVGKCFLGHETYGKLFREGPGRTLADVFVAVTQYEGDVAKPPTHVRVDAKDCALDRRTIVMTLGQTLGVYNVGTETYTPQLIGYPSPALILAIPNGDPIEFKPVKTGQYQLVDRTHSFIFADVFVLAYSSIAVSSIDGKFEIAGLPAGKAKLSAILPITGQTLDRDVEIPPGGALQVNLEFEFDDERDGAKARAKPDK